MAVAALLTCHWSATLDWSAYGKVSHPEGQGRARIRIDKSISENQQESQGVFHSAELNPLPADLRRVNQNKKIL